MSDNMIVNPQLWLLSTKAASKQLEKIRLVRLQSSGIERYNAIYSKIKQWQFLSGRWLMTYALSQIFEQPENYWVISENAQHGPTIDNLPAGYYFSLSHSQDIVVFTLSKAPIGVDIEQTKPRNNLNTLAKDFMMPTELQHFYLAEDPALFYRYWCLKEAVYKSMAPSAQRCKRLTSINVIELLQSHAENILELSSDNYQLTLFNKQIMQRVNCYKLSQDINEMFQQTAGSIRTIWTSQNITAD